MSPLIGAEGDLVLVGSALTVLAVAILFVWALCRAAAGADDAMERMLREDSERG